MYLWQGRVLSLSTSDMALLCVWERAILPRSGAKGDTLEVRVLLKLLQWQHEFNQTPNLRSMDVTLCYSSSPLLVLSLSIPRKPLRLCVLLSISCSLLFLTGVCMGPDMMECFMSFLVLLLGIFKCIKLPGWYMQYCNACRFRWVFCIL